MKLILVAVSVGLAVVASACSGRDDAESTPSTGASSTPTAAVITAVPASTPSRTSALLVPSRAMVIEVGSGRVTTVYESLNEAAYGAEFDGNVIELWIAGGGQRFNLDGSPAPAAAPGRACKPSAGGVEIDGRRFADVAVCGNISPDGRWMTYQVDAGEVTLAGGRRVSSWDQWVLDVSTGTTRELGKGLLDCGGCDSRYGPRWSPTSRFVAYTELGGEGRRFLSDVTTGETRVIGAGNDVGFAPQWAPTGNRIVYSSAQARPAAARFEDLDVGRSVELPVAWPVTFDASGRYLYSPAWGEGPKASVQATTVLDAATMVAVAALPGAPAWWMVWRPDDTSLVVGARGVVAALQGATGCAGTSVTVGSKAPVCVEGGAGGVVNADASFVAVAKAVGVTGHAIGPGFETVSLTRYAIDLFDVASGASRTAIPEVLSWDYQAPVMMWNEAGTHLLVLAPSAPGL